jgi:hypothetical protein
MQSTLFGIVKLHTPQDEGLGILDSSNFESLALQRSKHYILVRRGDVLDIVVYRNVRLSEVIDTDTLDSDNQPIIFSILDR